MRLIDADEIVKDDHQHYEYWSDEFYVTVNDIENAPTVDAVPVVHGTWILMTTRDDINGPERYSWNCSSCGYRRKSGESITVRMRKPKGKYCEQCGARMDKEDKDGDQHD